MLTLLDGSQQNLEPMSVKGESKFKTWFRPQSTSPAGDHGECEIVWGSNMDCLGVQGDQVLHSKETVSLLAGWEEFHSYF